VTPQPLHNNPKTIIFCLGCLSALAMAPVYAWPLMMLGYATLTYYLINCDEWKKGSVVTFLFFFGYFLTGLYWISSSLFIDFERWWWALPFSFVGLPILLSLFPLFIVGTALFFIKKHIKSKLISVFFIIIAIIATDFARSFLFTGFPWNLPAHTWVNTDILMSLLPKIGFFGLNTLTILLFCLPAIFSHKIRTYYVAALIIITFVPAPITKSNYFSAPDNIIMVQANIPQNEKWDRQFIKRNFDRYIDKSLGAIVNSKPHIIIWPETAISYYLLNHDQFRTKFQNFLADLPPESILITGVLTYNDNQDHFNSIIVYDRLGQVIARYDKHHLVPFGEYMPFGLDTITGFNNFKSGSPPEVLDTPLGQFIPLICYESIFSHYADYEAEERILLNLTNDAWFGHTAGPYQHFDHMIFRAMETGSLALRLSGNGISAIISPDGKTSDVTALNKFGLITTKPLTK